VPSADRFRFIVPGPERHMVRYLNGDLELYEEAAGLESDLALGVRCRFWTPFGLTRTRNSFKIQPTSSPEKAALYLCAALVH
jgi:hypothetical protein